MTSTRSGLGTRSLYTTMEGSSRFHLRGRDQPSHPVSRLRSAFWNDSCARRTGRMTSSLEAPCYGIHEIPAMAPTAGKGSGM